MADEITDGFWLKSLEDLAFLHGQAIEYQVRNILFGAPAELLTDDIIQTENQSVQSSCCGHGGTAGLEASYWIKEGQQPGKKPIQFNRQFLYIESQKLCGMFGRDQGSTISATVKAAMQGGCCLEDTAPYTGRYVTKFSQACYTEAAKYKLQSHSVLKSYEAVLNYQQTGLGGIVIGVAWTNALANSSGSIQLRDVQGRGGGHCVCLFGYDKNGRIRLHNSHGTQWGDNGHAWVDPEAVDYWCKNPNCEVIGVSDLSGVEPQRKLIDFTKIV
jgi:C1A family cysteine protease